MIKKTFEQILETNYPAGLHKKVMRRAWFLKHQTAIFGGAGAILVYFMFSAWNLLSKIVEMEFISTVKLLAEGAGAHLGLWIDAAGAAIQLAPAVQLANFALSLALAIYFICKFKKFNLLNLKLT